MGPSGNGLVERMKAGETPWNQGRSNGRPCPFQKAVPRTKENAAVERREARRSASWTGSPSCWRDGPDREAGQRGAAFRTSAFRRSAPSRLLRETSPRQRGGGKCPALPAPCENRGGGALAFFTRRLFEM